MMKFGVAIAVLLAVAAFRLGRRGRPHLRLALIHARTPIVATSSGHATEPSP